MAHLHRRLVSTILLLLLALLWPAGGGGNRKVFSLVFGGELPAFCCGVIGTSKFCLKGASCGVASHSKKFDWDPMGFDLKENESRAFSKPLFKSDALAPAEIKAVLEVKLTVEEFTTLFDELKQGLKPNWFPEANIKESSVQIGTTAADEADEELVSPKFATKDSGIFELMPKLSFSSDEGQVTFESELSPAEVHSLLQEYHKRFADLKTKWTQTFLEVEASHALVVKDLSLLHQVTSTLKTIVGTPDSSLSQSLPLVIGVRDLSLEVQGIAEAHQETQGSVELVLKGQQDFRQTIIEAIEESEGKISSATQEFYELKNHINTLTAVNKEFKKRFGIIFPILKDFKRGQQQPTVVQHAMDMQALQSQIVSLQQKVTKLEEEAWNQISSPPSAPTPVATVPTSSNLDATLLDIKHQLKVLQHRIVGGGVKIGNRVFQSFGDVQVWVKAELPTRRYGLFVDAVSILDFFSFLGHIDAESQVSTLHNANKAGFSSIYESRVATSVQNIFPKVFGKGDSHQYLPAIRHPDKWDDGSDGLMYQITKGMTDVETQLSSTIDTVLDGYHEARALASQCLFKAKRFVMDLCTFMSQDYFKWKARGHSKQDAWNMTSLCVRRIFEEIHSERVIARDIYDPNNLEFTTAKMLWATWKAHAVMEQYLRHHFYEHPSISAVLARHLADNYVKPEATSSSQITALEKAVKSLTSRLDKLDNLESDDQSISQSTGKKKGKQQSKSKAKDHE